MDTTTRGAEIVTRERRILAEVTRRGLKLERFGKAWRIYGRGVDVLAVTIQDFFETDLLPFD